MLTLPLIMAYEVLQIESNRGYTWLDPGPYSEIFSFACFVFHHMLYFS